MTQTFTPALLYRFVYPVLPGVIPRCTDQDRIFVWNLEFRSLEFICNLLFGAWNLLGSHLAYNPHEIDQLLLNHSAG